MAVLFQMILVMINVALGTINYLQGNMLVALFNAFAAGVCFALAVVAARQGQQ